MPILVTRAPGEASSPNRDKKDMKNRHDPKLLPQSSSDELLLSSTPRQKRGEDTSQGYLSSMDELSEIFNLRMYKIPRPKSTGVRETGSNKVKTKNILIGSSFYSNEDNRRRGTKTIRGKDAVTRRRAKAAAGSANVKMNELAIRLQKLKTTHLDEETHEDLKRRLMQSNMRKWRIHHGSALVEKNSPETQNNSTRQLEDVIHRALEYVEEHRGKTAAELFNMDPELQDYMHSLKRQLEKNKALPGGRIKVIKEHLLFADKNLRQEHQAPIEGVLYEANKAKKKPLKIKATHIQNHLAAPNAGGNPAQERRVPLGDKLNKMQADLTVSMMETYESSQRKGRHSVSFNDYSNQSSSNSIGISPRPPDDRSSSRGHASSRVSQQHRKVVANAEAAGIGGEGGSRANVPGDMTPRKGSFQRRSSKGEEANATTHKASSVVVNETNSIASKIEVNTTASFASMSIESAGSDELMVRVNRSVSMDSDDLSEKGDTSVDFLSPLPPSGTPPRGNRHRTRSDQSRTSVATATTVQSNQQSSNPVPTQPSKPAPVRPKSERLRARRLAMPMRYENSNLAEPFAVGGRLSAHDVKMASRIAESQLVIVKKQHRIRSKELKETSKRVSEAVQQAQKGSEDFICSWEKSSDRVLRTNHFFGHTLECKEKDWERDIKLKYDCFVMQGQDRGGEKLGVNFHVDMYYMRNRIKDSYFEIKMENLLNNKWFVVLVLKLREKVETVFTPIPESCFKFLLAVKELFVLGQSLTKEVFYTILEATVIAEDHKDIIIHRTLKTVRDVLQIAPDQFLFYLEKREIQPCPELLSQVRQHRKKIVHQSKLSGLAQTIKSGKATMLSSKARRWGNTITQENSEETSAVATPVDSRSITPFGPREDAGPETDRHSPQFSPTSPKKVTEGIKIDKSVKFSEEELIKRHRDSILQKQEIMSQLTEEAAEIWRQKHALMHRRMMHSDDLKNSALFETPPTSFEIFGDSSSTLNTSRSFAGVSNIISTSATFESLQESMAIEEEDFGDGDNDSV